jgi:hypothetical protein
LVIAKSSHLPELRSQVWRAFSNYPITDFGNYQSCSENESPARQVFLAGVLAGDWSSTRRRRPKSWRLKSSRMSAQQITGLVCRD